MDKIVSKREACERAGLHPTTVWRAQRRGEFPAFEKLSPGRVGLLQSNLELWLAGQRSGWSQGGGETNLRAWHDGKRSERINDS